jgi:hypothetical protein
MSGLLVDHVGQVAGRTYGSGFNAHGTTLLRHLSYLLTRPCEKSIDYRRYLRVIHISTAIHKRKRTKKKTSTTTTICYATETRRDHTRDGVRVAQEATPGIGDANSEVVP